VGDVHGRLIAFDLDGTLIDSRRDLTDSANQLIEELGGTPLSEAAVGTMIGEGARVLVQRVLEAAGLAQRETALPRFLAIYDTRLLNHTLPYEGVVDALVAAHTHGRVAVLTNKPLRPSERILEGLGLRALVDDVIGGDGPNGRKPDPAGLQALMARAHATAQRTLLVGDSAIDHATARQAAVRCCLVAYGFGNHTIHQEQLSGAEWWVRSAAELPGVFQRFRAASP
jgi:phosphoglycolate phosphatase